MTHYTIRLLALGALAFILGMFFGPPAFASDCKDYTVEVKPHTVEEDFSVTFKELSEESGNRGTFAATRRIPTASVIASQCKVVIGHEKFVVQVAKEIAARPCLKEHVLKHEYRHVAVVEADMQRYADDLPAYIKQYGLVDAVNKILDETAAKSRAIDTHEEYLTNFTACFGAITRTVNVNQYGRFF